MKVYKVICLLTLLFLSGLIEGHQIRITAQQAKRMGEQIWKNESGKSIAGLTVWNQGEDFPSMGIGHFIWHPKGLDTPFKESFPDLIQFFIKNGVQVPEWLIENTTCPWDSRDKFLKALHEPKLIELRKLLHETVDLQIYYMISRLKRALPILVANLHANDQRKIRYQFYRLCQTCSGTYALLDYLNFKGEGVSTQETYQGIGWGLRQALLAMKGRYIAGAVDEFVQSAKDTLLKRVQNSPLHRNEKRWLKGWYNRLDTYPNFS